MNYSQLIADGISVSGIFLLIALGLGITFGIMKVINMAHGELIMLGAYTAYVTSTLANLPFVVSLVAAFVVTGLVGAVMEMFVIRRLYGRPLETLLATFGISIILQQAVRMIFGPTGKSVASPFSGSLSVGEVYIPYLRLFIILFSATLVLITVLVFFKTKFGMLVRTVSQNRNMSDCLGINTARIDTLTFAFGAGLTGVAGAVLAPLRNVAPTMGVDYMIDSFMTVVLGGVGSLAGVAVGSFVLGEANQLLTIFGSETGAKIVVFLLIIIVIRFRPEGLFKIERR
ncbi:MULTISPECIES: urea ABC transporter permease subunit UrtB [unclassified Paenibacillus]|uniref:urea ABC transporter permease subunit UrtB n=1 Tax=unclassified Paenibacillus TaxID=185978 RepID=UPI0024071701|nr:MULTISPECIES: urea ABC transporter permease subunit UrtB [unclassified Paenibacillus]MDF9839780.1 urea transport system permease protein [Paenibacillus sp. PastF-2]MDF9846360.1 urea transport system permease protein [Paenibacillus sp. PastM-2]MDF9853290.1 urea transport system permease protein [Paenibacillus sp. PastF-1]MDH6478206.1 urea transport system permease protein [Paenibacillus sp. PastH-2]MDH6506295.1 urea transport system permease protein [Paenibacillus sp. PastM-3]